MAPAAIAIDRNDPARLTRSTAKTAINAIPLRQGRGTPCVFSPSAGCRD